MWTNLFADRYQLDAEADPTLAHFTVVALMFAAAISLVVAVFFVMRA